MGSLSQLTRKRELYSRDVIGFQGFSEQSQALIKSRLSLTYLEVGTSETIAVEDADDASMDAGVSADAKVVRAEGDAIVSVDDLTLEELTLRGTRVALLGLLDLN